MTVMSTTVTMISGRQHKRGRTPSTKALTSLTTEAQQESELVPEIKIHLLQQTTPLPMFITIDSTSHWISICSRATCRSIRARSDWSMNSTSTTTTVWSWPRVTPTPLTTSRKPARADPSDKQPVFRTPRNPVRSHPPTLQNQKR